MSVRKEKMTPDRFIQLFTEQALNQGQFTGMYEQFAANIPGDELSAKHFCEFLILSLFVDSLCLKWSFNAENADNLHKLHVKQVISEIAERNPAFCEAEFSQMLEKRFHEYHQAASEIHSVNIDTEQTLNSLTALGEVFSKHFLGHENLETILKVKWFFLMKEDLLYEKFLKGIKQNYELLF